MKRQNGAIDLVKFLFALLIVAAHYIAEYATGRIPALLDIGSSVYVVVVPFFFACSGYFLFRKVFANEETGKETIKSYLRRIGLMYGLWSVVYVGLQTAAWLRHGATAESWARYILNALTYSTYKTIWFLPALCIGVGLFWRIYRKKGIKRALIWSAVLYVLGCVGASYSFLLQDSATISGALHGYEYVFVSTRNGLFHGFPLVALGALIAYQEQRGSTIKPATCWILTILTGVAFVAEALVLKLFCDAVNVNTLFMLVPFTYFLIRTCLTIPVTSGKGLRWMRGMSTTVFLSQRLWLSALPELLPGTFFAGVLYGNPYLGLCWTLAATLLTAAALQWVGKRSRLIGAMC
ncbi:MAG: acyltransferase family protein [Oscillospiraceae bacterium]|nr:acyltransferase family protein [Oscillospiraceae bacterium]